MYGARLDGVLHVKTGRRSFPKDALFAGLERQGDHVWFTATAELSDGTDLNLFAGGHQSKLPLLLVASCSTTLPGKNQVKNWTTPDGVLHNIRNAQPKVAELHRT
eukprot:jgi/Mesvir1/13515/Mv06310-RA.1